MLSECKNDVIQLIGHKLPPHDLLSFMMVNRYMKNQICEENFWKQYCVEYWSEQFWEEAKQRPHESAKKTISYFYEFQRLMKYETKFARLRKRRPTIDEYRALWKAYDSLVKN